MKPRTKQERHLHREFENVLKDGGLTGQEKREARRLIKRHMSKTSRRIDKNTIEDELDNFDE